MEDRYLFKDGNAPEQLRFYARVETQNSETILLDEDRVLSSQGKLLLQARAKEFAAATGLSQLIAGTLPELGQSSYELHPTASDELLAEKVAEVGEGISKQQRPNYHIISTIVPSTFASARDLRPPPRPTLSHQLTQYRPRPTSHPTIHHVYQAISTPTPPTQH